LIPGQFQSSYAAWRRSADSLADTLKTKLRAELTDLRIVDLPARVKDIESCYQKLQMGEYESLAQIIDLVGLTVVLLYRKDVGMAIQRLKDSPSLVVEGQDDRTILPSEFSHREPKLFLRLRDADLDRHPEWRGLVAEVQFTTAIQHALDMTTHDFDYKGTKYKWSNFRLVARLRAMLELVDVMIDDIEAVSLTDHEKIRIPGEFTEGQAILDIIGQRWEQPDLPSDRRRLADTVRRWLRQAGLGTDEFASLLESHASSAPQLMDCASVILGILIQHGDFEALKSAEFRLPITSEMEDFFPKARDIPAGSRVDFGRQAPS
jgi:ppGpp synthetase/RelA/SpoT-type nucleotidyltranferase